MSRGSGRIEECVIAVLSHKGAYGPGSAVIKAVAASLDRPVSRALDASVRRALAALKTKGIVIQDDARAWMLAENYRRENEAARRRQRRERAKAREKSSQDYQAGDGGFDIADMFTPSPEVQRLARLLGMLGSDHDGEVLSAARHAEALRKKIGKDWLTLLSPINDMFL